ncbi:MAG: hypothetical protein M9897_12645 [Brumimicrobium sp.]|nr:hypothetical protein [Brumimicrobium sp.]
MRILILGILCWVGSFSYSIASIDTLFQKGVERLAEEDFNEARTTFKAIVEQEPSFAAYYNLGIAFARLNEWNHARWAFESALKYKPMEEDAQYNAQYALQQVNPKIEWQHPYSWYNRFVLGAGVYLWYVLALISSLLIGLAIYFSVSKYSKELVRKWINRLLPLGILLFIFSTYNVSVIKQHFNAYQFAIASRSEIKLYLSPNGLEVNEEIKYEDRFILEEYAIDSTWIHILTSENRDFWVKSEDMLVY